MGEEGGKRLRGRRKGVNFRRRESGGEFGLKRGRRGDVAGN